MKALINRALQPQIPPLISPQALSTQLPVWPRPRMETVAGQAQRLLTKGLKHLSRYEWEAAEISFIHVIMINQSSEMAWLALSETYLKRQRYGQALACLEFLLTINPDHDVADRVVQRISEKVMRDLSQLTEYRREKQNHRAYKGILSV